jgi:DNA-directed RNA polymerase subunit beta'
LCYGSDLATTHLVRVGEAVGIIAAQSIGEYEFQFTSRDFVGGLPEIDKIFEASRPNNAAVIAKVDGVVKIDADVAGNRRVLVIAPEPRLAVEHPMPLMSRLIVFQDDFVKKGERLTQGDHDPQDILDILGPDSLQMHLVDQIQRAHQLRGLEIADKHIEIIVRQMMRRVKVKSRGDTALNLGDVIDRFAFEEENRNVEERGGEIAECSPVIIGINKASLKSESLISRLLRQDASGVLAKAAPFGQVSELHGLEDHLVLGQVIPAGTGFASHRNIQVKAIFDTLPEEPLTDQIPEESLKDEIIDEERPNFESRGIVDLIGVIGC